MTYSGLYLSLYIILLRYMFFTNQEIHSQLPPPLELSFAFASCLSEFHAIQLVLCYILQSIFTQFSNSVVKEMESRQVPLPSYYSILGVGIDSAADDIRHAYRKLAMQWHPDRWTRTPSLLGEAKQKFQQIQEAYSVLSDQRKRTLYDVGLYDPDEEEEDEGYGDFLEEMMSLMAQNKDKKYSMDELQTMLVEISEGFEFSWWPCGPPVVRDSSYSESMQWDSDFQMGRNPEAPKWHMCGTGSCHCRRLQSFGNSAFR
ncbi:hypothetical protein HS088_TW02G00869 [Tripterygium wilfordii]|uniref:J domain-containing protein n=1 Tax=Tripterygium wilfordii TaxID=458696 RepID=A0A7J7DZN1_TRIWF|nr:chaperone protein DnaJ-like isoform X2 [Tripterygium wilfordii]KAF5751850.1 hypothetical protein HS088_TW02G00869 [Tripterygium wilfordii]